MAEARELIRRIYNGIAPVYKELGFSPVVDGAESAELPVIVKNEEYSISFKGADRALKVVFFDKKVSLSGALKDGEISEGDLAPVSMSLFDFETADDKDVKSLVNELTDSVTERFSAKKKAKSSGAASVKTVSKNKVENGGMSYDMPTLATRIANFYPPLKDELKRNAEKYDTLLAEEFFTEHANAFIMESIKKNDTREMKKLFEILNEIYLDGTGDTQSMITVTILGQLYEDESLLANCTDYMCPELTTSVIEVNRYLAKSKSARMRLENPPTFKPKKKKKTLGERLGQ